MKVESQRTSKQGQLHTLGISTTAKAALWVQHGRFWRYPTYHADESFACWRYKNTDSAALPKYKWQPDAPRPDYYLLPGTLAAIQNDDGRLYIANGEKSVLAYRAAGINNVLSWFGETNVPHRLRDDLEAWGVQTVIYPVDKDATGHKSGHKVHDLLYDSEIDCQIMGWGEDVPDKGDAVDQWVAVKFDAAAFRERLDSLQPITYPTPENPLYEPFRPNWQPDNTDAEWERVEAAAVQQLLSHLGITRFNRAGWATKNILATWRGEQTPSVTLNQSGWGYDHATGENIPPSRIAAAYGIPWPDWAAYHQRQPETTVEDGLVIRQAKQITWHERTLADLKAMPDSFRGALLAYIGKGTAAAPFVEQFHAAIREGQIDGNDFTLPQLEMALPQFSRATLYRLIDLLTGILCEPISDLDSKSTQQNDIVFKSETHYRLLSLKGFKSGLLRRARLRIIEAHHPVSRDNPLPTFEAGMLEAVGIDGETAQVAAAALNKELRPDLVQEQRKYLAEGNYYTRSDKARFEYTMLRKWLDDPHSTPLADGFNLSTVLGYRAALLRGHVEANPDQSRSNREKCRLLGCSKGSLKKIETHAGVKNIQQKELIPVESPAEVDQIARHPKGFPCAVVAIDAEGQQVAQAYQPGASEQFAQEQSEEDKDVFLEMQFASKQEIISEGPCELPKVPKRPPKKPLPSTPVRDEASEKPPKRYELPPFDPRRFNPRWVLAKLEKAAFLRGRLNRGRGVSPSGILIDDPTPDELIVVTLGYEPEFPLELIADKLARFAVDDLGAWIEDG